MRVGMTYDLRDDYLREGFSEVETAEFDRLSTIEAIETTLQRLGYEPVRIGHVRELARRLVAGERWDLVFNIAEGMVGLGREAQVPALLDAYRIPHVFSDAVVLGLTLHKAFTKHVLRSSGIPTPDFALVSTIADIARIDLPMPLFAKPVAEGTGKGITPRSRIYTRDELEAVCRDMLREFDQPVLVETFLPGREVTVGIVGTGEQAEAIATLEITLRAEAEAEVYSYTNKEMCEELVDYTIVTGELDREARALSLAAWRALGCRDAGRIDLRADRAGRLQVLELNPLAGLHPEHSDLPILATMVGMPYLELMDRIMRSALARLGKTPPPRR